MKLKSISLFIIMIVASLTADAEYISIDYLTPGQIRFSSKNVSEKVAHALKNNDAFFNQNLNQYEGKYCDGKSMFPENEALPVIRSPFGLVVTDGHHHILAALELGLKWVPIKEIVDLSNMDVQTFWAEAEKRNLVYLYTKDGCKEFPRDFYHLQDDPNRYFAAISARKYPQNQDPLKSFGAEFPIWIKVGKDIPFIEFRISDALRSAGLEYSYEMGDCPPESFIETARKILARGKIPGLRVVAEKTHYSLIDLN